MFEYNFDLHNQWMIDQDQNRTTVQRILGGVGRIDYLKYFKECSTLDEMSGMLYTYTAFMDGFKGMSREQIINGKVQQIEDILEYVRDLKNVNHTRYMACCEALLLHSCNENLNSLRTSQVYRFFHEDTAHWLKVLAPYLKHSKISHWSISDAFFDLLSVAEQGQVIDHSDNELMDFVYTVAATGYASLENWERFQEFFPVYTQNNSFLHVVAHEELENMASHILPEVFDLVEEMRAVKDHRGLYLDDLYYPYSGRPHVSRFADNQLGFTPKRLEGGLARMLAYYKSKDLPLSGLLWMAFDENDLQLFCEYLPYVQTDVSDCIKLLQGDYLHGRRSMFQVNTLTDEERVDRLCSLFCFCYQIDASDQVSNDIKATIDFWGHLFESCARYRVSHMALKRRVFELLKLVEDIYGEDLMHSFLQNVTVKDDNPILYFLPTLDILGKYTDVSEVRAGITGEDINA